MESRLSQLRSDYSDGLPGLLRYLDRKTRDRALSEDIAQQAFLKLWEKVQGGYEFKEAKPLLTRIAYDLFKDFLRKRENGLENEILASEMRDQITENEYLTHVVDKEEPHPIEMVFARTLALMNENIREAARLRFKDGWTNFQIALFLRVDERTVERYLATAKKKLISEFSKAGITPR